MCPAWRGGYAAGDAAGRSKKIDYCYERNGTAVLFLAYNIDTGECYTEVREHRKGVDYEEFIHTLLTEVYAEAEKLIIVQDNLNTHKHGSFYGCYEAEVARMMCRRIEFHFTPTHASWLNMAEILLSAISKQCLDRRIASIDVLTHEVSVWTKERNVKGIKVDWQFNIATARQKLQRHYNEQRNKQNKTQQV